MDVLALTVASRDTDPDYEVPRLTGVRARAGRRCESHSLSHGTEQKTTIHLRSMLMG